MLVSACGGPSGAGGPTPGNALSPESSPVCPAMTAAPDLPPGTTPEHRDVGYWLRVLRDQVDVERPLLEDHARRDLATRNERGPHRFDLTAPVDAAFRDKVLARNADFRNEASRGGLFDSNGASIDASSVPENASVVPPHGTFHRATNGFSLRCTPSESEFYRSATDRRFDRNSCSYVESGELVEHLGTTNGGLALIRTGYAFGYVRSPALGPSLESSEVARAVTEEQASSRRFTRTEVLRRAFGELDRHYGWGGQGGGLDCSSFVLSVLASFGVPMPRFSGDQTDAGNFRLDVPSDLDVDARRALLDSANRRGLVLVHFPGHVMLYLGRNDAGAPMAIHSYAEYVEPCATPTPDHRETVRTVDGVDVTTLDLGLHSSRTSYLERMTSITVFGASPGPELARFVAPRAAVAPSAAPCVVEDEPSIVRSPRRPYSTGELRLIWVGDRPPGPVAVSLTRSDGRRVELQPEAIDGPPYGLVARWPEAEAGSWTAWFGDGNHRLACENIVVEPERIQYLRPVTSARNLYTPEIDSLWSVFVQKLFDYPVDDRTWPDLQTLLRDPARNLLFDHFTAEEESRLELEPDCADLPFVLRAYFAWKLGLPFGVRSCSRGSAGRPPACGPPTSNVEWIDEEALAAADGGTVVERPIEDFRKFATAVVASTVHSASVRTAPNTDASDLYPLPLTRDALRPGTVYADPYGHVMLLVRWIRGAEGAPGRLIAADAQPDGTIGRPRFWRGTFLFTPETSDVGAGFKAFRPVELRGEGIRELDNDVLRHRPVAPFSMAQYEGDTDAFYDRVEALIDPEPLDAETRLVALVDALEDSARRRTVSVDNAEAYVAAHPGQTIPMPLGGEIFQTEGSWEDYSTPSRDMRLLLALDTVLSFPDAVRRRPERFGLAANTVDATVRRVRERLERELASRSFVYRGTRGVETRLTLADLRSRMRALEVAYDPNDCPEVRWGAPEGSSELSRCGRRAPNDQRSRLETYRVWFAERRRPLR